jgi:hypothetical protein
MIEAISATPESDVRFCSKPPDWIRVRLCDLEKNIPSGRLYRQADPDEIVELASSQIFDHVVPTLQLSELAKAVPGYVEACEGWIKLPIPSIVLSYQLEETMDPCFQDFSERKSPPLFPSPVISLEAFLAQNPAESDESPAPEPTPEVVTELEIGEISSDETIVERSASPSRLSEIISNLPTFRRIRPEESALVPSTLHLEPTIVPRIQGSDEVVEQENLQALFLTEEKLSIQRVVQLCGELPGIKSCLLTHDNSVVSSHNVPDGVDIVSLSGNASAMLHAMREASSGMGLGTIPALTLHSDKGPLTIFHQENLSLFVFHGDRGFIPGVREKMTAALNGLSQIHTCLPSTAE